jgi:hypothetical protein
VITCERFWAVGEDFFPDSGVFLLGKNFFANSSGFGCWESSELLAKPQFPVVHRVCRFAESSLAHAAASSFSSSSRGNKHRGV